MSYHKVVQTSEIISGNEYMFVFQVQGRQVAASGLVARVHRPDGKLAGIGLVDFSDNGAIAGINENSLIAVIQLNRNGPIEKSSG